ncbi:MAG: T9SS type A sorting domain-containing protein [Bacteroidetes bacterium]|nr:T9SS type A sorting domain-containing protein [Bacteroidota bacterium]
MKRTTFIIRRVICLLILSFIAVKYYCTPSAIKGTGAIITAQTLAKTSCKDVVSLTIDSFIGVCSDQQIILKWVTLSGITNDHFVVEKSDDDINWTELAIVAGSSPLSGKSSYVFIDTETKNTIVYYRLKHINTFSNFSYSTVIDVSSCNKNATEENLTLYPNPSIGVYNLSISSDSALPESIEIFNDSGEKVYQCSNSQSVIDLSKNPVGLYFVHATVNEKTIIRKIILKKD